MIYKLTNSEKKQISSDLQCDIEIGVYNNWPKAKKKMEHISQKLINMCYMNGIDLSYGEYETLADNGYINRLSN